jgi:hypothetical protein
MVVAINRNLSLPGWLFRIRGGGGHYKYNSTATLGFGVDYQVGEAMVGYQWFVGPSRITLYLGGNVEHHNNSDPTATVKGSELGFKAQGEIYTSLSQNMYTLLLGAYSTAFESYFVLGKLGYRVMPTVSIGPEVAALGNERFDAVRAGGFFAFEINPSASIIISGGYSWDERSTVVNDSSGGYGTVHLRKLL